MGFTLQLTTLSVDVRVNSLNLDRVLIWTLTLSILRTVTVGLPRVEFQLFDRFLGKILQPAILTHSASKVARSIDFDLKKILPSSEF